MHDTFVTTATRHSRHPSVVDEQERHDAQQAQRVPGSIDDRLAAHLRAWLGTWPPRRDLDIVIWPGRDLPGWDGTTWLGLGVESPLGAVLSLSPRLVAETHAVDDRLLAAALAAPDPALAISTALGQPGLKVSRSTFRWSDQPAELPEVGEWVHCEDPRVPAWLQAFNSDVLVAWDDQGQVAAGVGRKRHNRFGHELAVGTEPAHQGRGLARKLIAQAARRVLADGTVPLYFHLPDNAASARVADAAGFPDRGWHVVGLY